MAKKYIYGPGMDNPAAMINVSEAGLYYYRFRDYSPDLGRFLQTDPLGTIDGMNLYAYVNNNLLNWVDPWGLCGKEVTDEGTSWIPNVGFEISGSSINPFTSGCGGVYGWYHTMTFDDGTGSYSYGSKREEIIAAELVLMWVLPSAVSNHDIKLPNSDLFVKEILQTMFPI